MPRAKAFDPDVVLERAVELFWQLGYDGASMAKLLAAMKISRQSLYDTFGDKHTLFLLAIDRYRERTGDGIEAMLAEAETPLAGIRACFDWVLREVIDRAEYRSCFMANSALELGQRDPEVRERVGAHLSRVEGLMHGALEQAQARGELTADRELRDLARLLTTTIHGIGIMARGGVPPEQLRASVNAALGSI